MIDYIKGLFSNAKNVVMDSVKNVMSSAKKKLARSIINEFGPDVIDVTADMIKEKGTQYAQEAGKEIIGSPVKIMKSFIDTLAPKNIEPLEQKFEESIEEARRRFNAYADQLESPLAKECADTVSNLFNIMNNFKNDAFKYTKKSLASVHREGARALRNIQPELERWFTKTIIQDFLAPLLNFFATLLKSLFSDMSPSEPRLVRDNLASNQTATPPASPVSHQTDHEAQSEDEAEDAYYDTNWFSPNL